MVNNTLLQLLARAIADQVLRQAAQAGVVVAQRRKTKKPPLKGGILAVPMLPRARDEGDDT